MYIQQEISERIKSQAKKKNVVLKDMLKNIGTGVNLISHLSKGQEISYLTLAKIADYLDCSVDYLLCRTENPNAHKTHANDAAVNPYDDRQLMDIINIYKRLDSVGKAKALVAIDAISKEKTIE